MLTAKTHTFKYAHMAANPGDVTMWNLWMCIIWFCLGLLFLLPRDESSIGLICYYRNVPGLVTVCAYLKWWIFAVDVTSSILHALEDFDSNKENARAPPFPFPSPSKGGGGPRAFSLFEPKISSFTLYLKCPATPCRYSDRIAMYTKPVSYVLNLN